MIENFFNSYYHININRFIFQGFLKMINSKKKIKIAFFLHSLEGAGAERNTINLIRNLNKEKYQISLILVKAGGAFMSQIPREVLVTDLKTKSFFVLFLKLREYFKKQRPDIFISSYPHFNSISALAKIFSKSRTKIILVEHTTFSLISSTARTFFRKIIARFFLPFLMKFIYPRADAIICVSQGVARDISKIINSAKKIKVIYNPVTNDKIYKWAQEAVLHHWFFDQKIPVILAVGRLTKAKDYPNLLKALNQIVKEKPVRLVILGEGTEEIKIKKIIKKLDLSKNTALLGFKENPYKFMKRASVLALSSFREGFGDVIVEAMACGLPVVSTNCAGPSEIIENGKNGILVPRSDERALAKGILQVLNNSFLAQKLSKQGLNRAKDFSVEKSIKEYEEVFEEIINRCQYTN